MRVFLLDLWLDLREKRLAPIAILLLAGIVAVPIVLAKSNDENTPAPAPSPTATTAAATPVVASQPAEGVTASKLQTFSPRDPFEPTSKAAAATTTTATSGTSTSSSSSTSTSSGGGSSSSGTGTSTAPSSSTGGGGATTGNQPSTGNGNGNANGNGNGNGNGSTGNTTGETKTTLFTYTVDLRFGQGGSVKAYKKVNRLDLIPDSNNPKIVFLGVTTTGKTAVFLIDSNIGVDSAGKCRPSADECTFLYLRPDGVHDQAQLTDSDGTVYHLRLLAIHRVTVSSANGNTGSGNGNSKGNSNKRSPAFTGRADSSKSADSATVPGGDTPPGEPDQRATFSQFFADSAASK
jgi:hypothetical protein